MSPLFADFELTNGSLAFDWLIKSLDYIFCPWLCCSGTASPCNAKRTLGNTNFIAYAGMEFAFAENTIYRHENCQCLP